MLRFLSLRDEKKTGSSPAEGSSGPLRNRGWKPRKFQPSNYMGAINFYRYLHSNRHEILVIKTPRNSRRPAVSSAADSFKTLGKILRHFFSHANEAISASDPDRRANQTPRVIMQMELRLRGTGKGDEMDRLGLPAGSPFPSGQLKRTKELRKHGITFIANSSAPPTSVSELIAKRVHFRPFRELNPFRNGVTAKLGFALPERDLPRGEKKNWECFSRFQFPRPGISEQGARAPGAPSARRDGPGPSRSRRPR